MCRFVAFSRLPANHTGRLIADKGVVFAESLIPAVFFREMKLKLPAGVPTQPLQSLQQVSAYLHKIHRLAFCIGTGLHDPIRSMKCRIYVDMPSSVRRCTACSTQRQAVLFGAQQKVTWGLSNGTERNSRPDYKVISCWIFICTYKMTACPCIIQYHTAWFSEGFLQAVEPPASNSSAWVVERSAGSSQPITMSSITQKTVLLCFNITCLQPC